MYMTITEHIQDVAGAISAQKSELEEIQSQRKQASLMTGIWLLVYGAMLSANQTHPVFVTIGVAFLAFNVYRLVRFERAFRLTSVLLSDNEQYKAIIVNEAYSGKEAGPQD